MPIPSKGGVGIPAIIEGGNGEDVSYVDEARNSKIRFSKLLFVSVCPVATLRVLISEEACQVYRDWLVYMKRI